MRVTRSCEEFHWYENPATTAPANDVRHWLAWKVTVELIPLRHELANDGLRGQPHNDRAMGLCVG